MAGEVTSPQSPGVWRHFADFVRHPVLPDHATGVSAVALRPMAKLFALDLLLMTVLIGIAAAAAALGFEMPSHMLDEIELTPLLIAFILVGAPLGEELLFRGLLSGKPAHVSSPIIAGLTVLAAGVLSSLGLPLVGVGLLGAMLVLVTWQLWRKRGRPPMPFFARHFRWFYFGSALAFASIHLANFTEGNALVLLPLTLPQFLLGLILGYARVHFGLWASILLHAAHNSLFVGLLLAGAG